MTTGLKPTRSKWLPGLLLLPLLGLSLAAGCSSPQSVNDAAPATSSSASGSGTTGNTGKATPTKPSSPSPEADEAQDQDPEAVLQTPQPAPEPVFDAAEQQFLADKVPEGYDPNAVLQVGQEHCDQLTSANELDGEAVLSELIMHPATDTSDAIASLCPELLPVLEAAALGFPDGAFTVGEAAPWAEEPSIGPGTYRAYGSPEACTISVYAGSGELIDSYDGTTPVTIGADAARVESDQCYSWARA
ncbi:hypothetical protein [Arthrobacter koreensis]|uniref:hypothetical protein n=1 Tax=Arthrobacter TaxID=1663 RepID=UPI0036DBA5AF